MNLLWAGMMLAAVVYGAYTEDIVQQLLEGYEIEYFDNIPTKYLCDCSRERTDRALISLGETELKKIIEEDGKAEITCHFCDKKYSYTKEQLLSLMKGRKK